MRSSIGLNYSAWREIDWVHHDFLVSMSRFLEKENKLIWYDGWHLHIGSMFAKIQDKYCSESKK